MAFNFKKQLEVGSAGEKAFMERYPTKITIHPEHSHDFDCVKTGKKIELKSDTYNINKTDNFFMERYSDVNKKTPGGVWQSHEKGVDIFCYYFVRHNIWFQFNDLPKLLERLNEVSTNKGLVFIKNRAWTTAGYALKRELFEDLYDIWEF